VGLPPGTGEAQVAEAATGQQAATTLQNAANEIPTQRTQLDLMRNDLKQAESKFGRKRCSAPHSRVRCGRA
jgi:hypothetical protein